METYRTEMDRLASQLPEYETVMAMTGGMTKFLRIYYGKVRDGLKEQGLWEQTPGEPGKAD